jgi:hypothetical protein
LGVRGRICTPGWAGAVDQAPNHLVDGFGQITPLGGVGGEAALTATDGTTSSMELTPLMSAAVRAVH